MENHLKFWQTCSRLPKLSIPLQGFCSSVFPPSFLFAQVLQINWEDFSSAFSGIDGASTFCLIAGVSENKIVQINLEFLAFHPALHTCSFYGLLQDQTNIWWLPPVSHCRKASRLYWKLSLSLPSEPAFILWSLHSKAESICRILMSNSGALRQMAQI